MKAAIEILLNEWNGRIRPALFMQIQKAVTPDSIGRLNFMMIEWKKDELAILYQILSLVPELKHFSIRCELSNHAFSTFLEKLKVLPALETIDIQNDALTDNDAEMFAAWLSNNSILQAVYLESDQLSPQGISFIATAANRMRSLISFLIRGNFLDNQSSETIIALILSNKLKQFTLNLARLSTNEIQKISENMGDAIGSNNSLEKLFLHFNELSDEHYSVFLERIKKNLQLKKISILVKSWSTQDKTLHEAELLEIEIRNQNLEQVKEKAQEALQAIKNNTPDPQTLKNMLNEQADTVLMLTGLLAATLIAVNGMKKELKEEHKQNEDIRKDTQSKKSTNVFFKK